MSEALLQFSGIEKAFFDVKVLRGITFSVGAGEVLGLVGENGAGKSTLMNILGGNLRADAGKMMLAGAAFSPSSAQEAQRSGISFIHQELNLFPNLSIAHNLFLPNFPRAFRGTPFIAKTAMHRQAAVLLERVGLLLSPSRLVESLSPGQRQLVEIAKVLQANPRLIIFDEPATSLAAPECERLFSLIEELRRQGIASIYISHNLKEIFRLCGHVVVLRDGAVVGSGPTQTFSEETIISLMVGRTLNQLFPKRTRSSSGEVVLEARNVSRAGVLQDISFQLHAGEVLGLAGLMGAGRTELARALFGLDRIETGEVRIAGAPLVSLAPRRLIQRGLAFLTENRHAEGLCLEGTVAENLTLPDVATGRANVLRWLNRGALAKSVRTIRAVVRLDEKVRDAQVVRTLSGGNQQKVVLGKWLMLNPRLFILDEPTRGIDIGAKTEIYRLIDQLASKGAAVLLISSEIEELLGLSDRILVMQRGRFVDELKSTEFDRERILRSALGGLTAGRTQ